LSQIYAFFAKNMSTHIHPLQAAVVFVNKIRGKVACHFRPKNTIEMFQILILLAVVAIATARDEPPKEG